MQAIQAHESAGLAAFSNDWNTGYKKGTFATVTCPAWMMGYIQGQAPKSKGKWDIASVPGGGGNWGGSFLTVPKQGSHTKEAYDLAKFLTSPASEAYIFKQTGNLPSQPALYKSKAITGFKNPFFNNAPVGKIFTRLGEEAEAAGDPARIRATSRPLSRTRSSASSSTSRAPTSPGSSSSRTSRQSRRQFAPTVRPSPARAVPSARAGLPCRPRKGGEGVSEQTAVELPLAGPRRTLRGRLQRVDSSRLAVPLHLAVLRPLRHLRALPARLHGLGRAHRPHAAEPRHALRRAPQLHEPDPRLVLLERGREHARRSG